MRRYLGTGCLVLAVVCLQTFKGYGVVHDRVELDSLDRFGPLPEFSSLQSLRILSHPSLFLPPNPSSHEKYADLF